MFSRRAVDALRDMLEPNGELLPVEHKGVKGNYFVYNVQTVSNALDVRKSDYQEYRPLDIFSYAFIPEKLVGATVFMLPVGMTYLYVTTAFVERVKSAKLHGFGFDKVWPLPEGVDWRREHKRRWSERRKKVAALRRQLGVKVLDFPPLEPGE